MSLSRDSKKPKEVFSQEEVIQESATNGNSPVDQQQLSTVVWSSMMVNTVTVLLLMVSGILGISVFLMAMLIPYFD